MLRLLRRAALFAPLALLLLSLPFFNGCDSSEPMSPSPDTSPSFEILDAAHSMGNPDFFFLPPLVPNPSGSEWFEDGEFDAGLWPSVEICAVVSVGDGEEECPEGSPPVASFAMDGADPIQVSEMDQHYQVNWQLDGFDLDPQVTYRIRVLLGDNEVGHADVDLVSSGKELKNVDTGHYIPLKDGRTLPILFRLEEGVGSYVGFSGGTVFAEDGSWSLEIGKGTLETTVGITASLLSDPDGALPGTAWDFGPEGTEFNPPAILTIWYNPDDLTPGKYPRLHKLIDGVWQPVEGSIADITDGTVTGPVTDFSVWAVLGTEVNLDIYVTGGRGEVKIDGWTPPVGTPPCDHGYPDPPCTAILDYGAPVTLIADEIGFPDGLFEEWLGDVSDFECPTDEKICSFTMTGDRSVTARFSMPGFLTLDRYEESFLVLHGSDVSNTVESFTLTNIGGRTATVQDFPITYSPEVEPWLGFALNDFSLEPGQSEIVSLTLLAGVATDLPPGKYGASVPVLTGGDWGTGGVIAVNLIVATVDGSGREAGPLPAITYALADDATGEDVFPLGEGAIYRFGLFDTGSSSVNVTVGQPYVWTSPGDGPNSGLSCSVPNRLTDANWWGSDADSLGLNSTTTARIRLNGLSAIDPLDLSAPIEMGQAEFERSASEIRLSPDPGLDVTLIGASVSQELVAFIDYTQGIRVSGFDFYPGLSDPGNSGIFGFTMIDFVEGPDISFHSPGVPGIPSSETVLPMEQVGSPALTNRRWYLNSLQFHHGAKLVDGSVPDELGRFLFLYDTGSTRTIVGERIAEKLGLTPGEGEFDCQGGVGNGYYLDGVIIPGSPLHYVVGNAAVCWNDATLGASLSAIIGSNLFDQVPVVFDGSNDLLGIGAATDTPINWETWQVRPPNCGF